MRVAHAALALELDGARRLVLSDSRSGAAWQSLAPLAALRLSTGDDKPAKRLPGCRLDFTPLANGIHGRVRCPRADAPEILVAFDLLLQDDALRIAVHPAQGLRPGEVVELECPRGLGWQAAGAQGYLVLPMGLGALCDFSPQRKARRVEQFIYSGGQTGLTLPVFGVVSGKQALAAIVDSPFDCKLKMALNAGRPAGYGVTPVWVFEDRLNTPREVRYLPLPGGDYVAIAKRYRADLMAGHEYVSLREKARGAPEVENLCGALLGHRHLAPVEPPGADCFHLANAYGFFRAAQRAGFDRVVAHDTIRGNLADLKAAADFARSLSPGFRLSVYDNFLDIFKPGEQPWDESSGVKCYPPFDESLITRERDGSLRRNFRVERKGKPDIWTYAVCPARRLDVARPQIAQMLATLGRGSIYIDVEGAVPLSECFSHDHPVTREQDCHFRRRLLAGVKQAFGAVSTEAAPIGCLAPAVEVGSYFSLYQYSGHGNSLERVLPPLIPIPLHPLVFHGSLLNQTAVGDGYYQCHAPHVPLYGFLPDTMDDQGLRVSYQMRATCWAELLEHRFLTGPRIVINAADSFQCDDVEFSRFSDGTVVVGNFASVPYHYQGHVIPPMDFLILHEGLEMALSAHPAEVRPGDPLTVRLSLRNTGTRSIEGATFSLLLRGAAQQAPDLADASLPILSPGQALDRSWAIRVPDDAATGRLILVGAVSIPSDVEPSQPAELAFVTVVP